MPNLEEIERLEVDRPRAVTMPQIVDRPGIDRQVFEFNAHQQDLVDDFAEEAEFTRAVKSVKSKTIEKQTYRTILAEDKRNIYHVALPVDCKFTDKEILDRVLAGSTKDDVWQIGKLPSKTPENLYEEKGLKLKSYSSKKKEVKKKIILSIEQFFNNTTKLFTLSKKEYIGDAYVRTNSSFVATVKRNENDYEQSTCEANVYTVCQLNDGTYIKAVTTGRFDYNTNTVEIIGIPVHPTLDSSGMRYNYNYISGTSYKKYMVPYRNIIPIDYTRSSFTTYDFCRVLVSSFEDSSEVFGNRRVKKNMLNTTFTPLQFKITRNYFSVKLNKRVDVIELMSETETFVKFLLSDVSFLYLDPNNFGFTGVKKSKIISAGSSVKVKDDRRTRLKKGDRVTVIKIQLNHSSKRNSNVTVKDSKGNTHSILLKQLKAA